MDQKIYIHLKKPPEVFQSVCTSLRAVSVAPHLYQPYVVLLSLILAILVGEWWVSHCGFNFNFPDKDIEHIFVCLLAISVSSFAKRLFKSSAHFVTGFLILLLLIFRDSSYVLGISPSMCDSDVSTPSPTLLRSFSQSHPTGWEGLPPAVPIAFPAGCQC